MVQNELIGPFFAKHPPSDGPDHAQSRQVSEG